MHLASKQPYIVLIHERLFKYADVFLPNYINIKKQTSFLKRLSQQTFTNITAPENV